MNKKHRIPGIVGSAFLALLSFLWLEACTSSDTEEKEMAPTPGQDFEVNDESIGSNVDHNSYVHSLSNNPMTSRLVDFDKAKAIAAKLSSAPKGDAKTAKENITAILTAERLANAPVERLMQHAQRLADLEQQEGIDKNISDEVRLELVIAAIKQHSYGIASFFLDEIAESRNKRVKAGAQNALGLLALFDDRVPEAVQHWRNALAAVPGYEAALLNLGFTSLKYASFNDAEKLLSRISNDWFAQSGKFVANRLIGDTAEASRLCTSLLTKVPNHKPTIFNCGVHEWQSNNNIPKAKKLMGQALAIKGGPAVWDTQGYKTLEDVQ